ncbi:unnamed protein product, partial [Brachionus calyciflorus]
DAGTVDYDGFDASSVDGAEDVESGVDEDVDGSTVFLDDDDGYDATSVDGVENADRVVDDDEAFHTSITFPVLRKHS